MNSTTPKPFLRTAIAAGVVAAVVAATALATPADAGTPATAKTAGQANAIATSYKVNPTTASLSIGIGFGISLAGYTNQVSQAESRGIDLGIIGGTLAGEACDGGDPTLPAEDQPQPLRADSRDANASQVRSENEKYLPLINKAVRADATPSSQADTITAGLTGSEAFLDLGAAKSRAVARLVDGTREAVGTVDIDSVGIAGVIELSGLHWEASARSGTVEDSQGIFTIGKLKVLGQELPANDSFSAIENANAALAPLGIQINYPKTRVAAGIRFVDPMTIRVVPSQTRDGISQLVIGAVQPVRENIVAALLAQDCGNDTYITVADIVLGSVTGAGSFSIELGGASAKSDALKTSNFLTGGLSPAPPASSSGGLGFGGSSGGPLNNFDDSPSLGVAPSTNAGTGTSGNTGNKPSRQAAPVVSVTEGSRGGKMAMVGLLGLVALGIVADRDRRLMRRAQRSIATEA